MNGHPLPLCIVAVMLAGSARTLPAAPQGAQPPAADDSPAVAIEREVERIAAANTGPDALWPGYDPLAIPLAVYDGERTFLFRHPAPPGEFTPFACAVPGTFACQGRYEAVTANTNAAIGGVGTATLVLDRPQPGRALLDLAAIAVHEAFHVFQRAHHPGWIGNEADLFVYPTDSAELLMDRRLETSALSRALAAEDAKGAACWAHAALEWRGDRYAHMDPAFAAYERGTELNEGLATYVEMRAAGRRALELPEAEFGPTEVRRRAYATGPAFALLLDRFKPGWPAGFESDDHQTLDGALAAALGAGDTCSFDAATMASTGLKARQDVAALAAERERRLVGFAAKPGWRVVVETGGGEPLRARGFDPLNVERVGPIRVLHGRYLKLGNAAGQMEVMDAVSLTDGVGPHPLFQGVRRIEVAGLGRPGVDAAEGRVTVQAPGLTLEFRGATVAQSGEVVTVRVGS